MRLSSPQARRICPASTRSTGDRWPVGHTGRRRRVPGARSGHASCFEVRRGTTRRLSIRQTVGEIRLAGIGGKRRTRPLLVFSFLLGLRFTDNDFETEASGDLHVVTPGETLFRIGKAYGVAYQELARINGIKDAGRSRSANGFLYRGDPSTPGGNDHARGACAGSASFTRAGVRDISLAGKRDDQLGIWTAGLELP